MDIKEWVKTAKKGDRTVYHTGPYCAGPNRVAANDLAQDGLIVLVQRRADEDGTFHYIAARTGESVHRPKPVHHQGHRTVKPLRLAEQFGYDLERTWAQLSETEQENVARAMNASGGYSKNGVHGWFLNQRANRR